jgi:hypothetical protein
MDTNVKRRYVNVRWTFMVPPGEEPTHKCSQMRRTHIPKVMFLCAIANSKLPGTI